MKALPAFIPFSLCLLNQSIFEEKTKQPKGHCDLFVFYYLHLKEAWSELGSQRFTFLVAWFCEKAHLIVAHLILIALQRASFYLLSSQQRSQLGSGRNA